MKKTNSKYRVPGPRPAPTGYQELEPVKLGTHQVLGPKKFYPKLKPDATGSNFLDPDPDPVGPGPDSDPEGPYRVRV